jgi:dTDP-L-rhamnose 4-epimerase
MKSVLITGGAGFIGTHLTRALCGHVGKIVLLDNLLPQVHHGRTSFPAQDIAECIPGDVRDMAVWRRIATEHPDIDTIIHLAAMTGTGQSMYALREYDSVNCGGTAAMLEALLDRRDPAHGLSRVRHVVLASSRAIYGEGAYHAPGTPATALVYPAPRTRASLERQEWDFRGPDGQTLSPVPTPETAPAQPNSFYGITKLVQEQYLQTMLPGSGISHTILRFQNVFGDGQSLKNPYTGVIGVFYSNIVSGRAVEIYEDGRVTRDFVYVSDVVDAVIKAATGRSEGTYNIGTGEFTLLEDVARWLCEALGREVPIECRGTYRVGDIRNNAADLTRATAELGYRSQFSVKDGLRRYVNWAQHERPLDAATIADAAAELRAAGLSKSDA